MSFLGEIKRRKVFKVAAVYAVVAWLIIQVAGQIAAPLGLPLWFESLVIVLLGIGFPLALILGWIFDFTPEGIHATAPSERSESGGAASVRSTYIIQGLVLLAVGFLVVDQYILDTAVPARPTVTPSSAAVAGVVILPEHAEIASGIASIGFDSPLITVSPDGSWLVYVGRDGSGSRLYRRRLSAFEPPEAIPGTDGALHAFFSPDSQVVGFLTEDRLRRVGIDGDDLRTIATHRTATRGRWIEGGFVYFADDQGNALRRVSSEGGDVETLYDSDPGRFSDIHPDGHFVLAFSESSSISGDHGSIFLLDLRTSESRDLNIAGYDARFVATGDIVFARNGNVMAVAFDSETGTISGEPVSVLRDVAMDTLFKEMQLAVSAEGTVVYVPGADRSFGQIVAIARQDDSERIISSEAQLFGVLDLSPDDRTLAVHVADVQDYIWTYDLVRQSGRKLADSDGFGWPVWSRDAQRLAYSSGSIATGERLVVSQGTDSSAAPPLIHQRGSDIWSVSDWSPSGDELSVYQLFTIGFVSTAPNAVVEWVDAAEDFSAWGGVYSPDGNWVAYTSDETGRYEIWIRSHPDGGVNEQITSAGGVEPVWCPCGEVFYRRGNQVFSLPIDLETGLSVGTEQFAFSMQDFIDTPGSSFDVSSDGQTLFTVIRAEPAVDSRIHVISNWFGELQDLIPTVQ